MTDGLYRVTTKYLCAGFVVKDGWVVMCAPVLRKRLDYWQTIAIKIETWMLASTFQLSERYLTWPERP